MPIWKSRINANPAKRLGKQEPGTCPTAEGAIEVRHEINGKTLITDAEGLQFPIQECFCQTAKNQGTNTCGSMADGDWEIRQTVTVPDLVVPRHAQGQSRGVGFSATHPPAFLLQQFNHHQSCPCSCDRMLIPTEYLCASNSFDQDQDFNSNSS